MNSEVTGLDPPVDRDVVDLDAAFSQQFLNVAVRQAVRRYQRTATAITSRVELVTGQGGVDETDLSSSTRLASARDPTIVNATVPFGPCSAG